MWFIHIKNKKVFLMRIIILLILFPLFIYSQTKDINGLILNNKNIPIESANIIAKPLNVNKILK